MSRTRKDSRRATGTVLEIVKTESGEFDVFINRVLRAHHGFESSLTHYLCVGLGYCDDELAPILHELNLTGRKTIVS
jgi:hypothetical protein